MRYACLKLPLVHRSHTSLSTFHRSFFLVSSYITLLRCVYVCVYVYVYERARARVCVFSCMDIALFPYFFSLTDTIPNPVFCQYPHPSSIRSMHSFFVHTVIVQHAEKEILSRRTRGPKARSVPNEHASVPPSLPLLARSRSSSHSAYHPRHAHARLKDESKFKLSSPAYFTLPLFLAIRSFRFSFSLCPFVRLLYPFIRRGIRTGPPPFIHAPHSNSLSLAHRLNSSGITLFFQLFSTLPPLRISFFSLPSSVPLVRPFMHRARSSKQSHSHCFFPNTLSSINVFLQF